MAEDVLVIGAGPAGIACAWTLEQAGIGYRVVDRADVIASTLNAQYPTLHLQRLAVAAVFARLRHHERSVSCES